MRARAVVAAVALAAGSCTVAHLDRITLDRDGRELPDLFLGGWDGHRLTAFDESTVEPGVTTRDEALRILAALSADLYAVLYLEIARFPAAIAQAHDLVCEAPACLVVFDRKRGVGLSTWGDAVAVIEIAGVKPESVVSAVWIAGKLVRPPGPRRWDLRCRSTDDQPRWVHPDGGALFPARQGRNDGFARFGRTDVTAAYRRGEPAPAETTCSEEAARVDREEPPPERPVFKPDPALLPPPEKPAKPPRRRSGRK